MSEKECRKCSTSKMYSEFVKDRTRSDGLAHWCKDCSRAYLRHWKATATPEVLAKMKKDVSDWRANNPDRKLQLDRRYRNTAKGKQMQLEFLKKWRPNNRSQVAAQAAYRRSMLMRAVPLWVERDKIKEVYKQVSVLTRLLSTQFHVDHIIPVVSDTVCGLHCWHNLQVLTKEDNLEKSNTYQQDW